MDFMRTSAIVLRQFYLVRGSISRLVPLFVWVGVDMVLWGFITRPPTYSNLPVCFIRWRPSRTGCA